MKEDYSTTRTRSCDCWLESESCQCQYLPVKIPNTNDWSYRGAVISVGRYGGFTWSHDDHIEITNDIQPFGCGHCNTVQECVDEIDDMFLVVNKKG